MRIATSPTATIKMIQDTRDKVPRTLAEGITISLIRPDSQGLTCPVKQG